jgi:hypothetical protein
VPFEHLNIFNQEVKSRSVAGVEHLNIFNQDVKSRILRERQCVITTPKVNSTKITESIPGTDPPAVLIKQPPPPPPPPLLPDEEDSEAGLMPRDCALSSPSSSCELTA